MHPDQKTKDPGNKGEQVNNFILFIKIGFIYRKNFDICISVSKSNSKYITIYNIMLICKKHKIVETISIFISCTFNNNLAYYKSLSYCKIGFINYL